MGCGGSKSSTRSTATKPISRCKDRRRRIKRVIGAREAFERAHVAYSNGLRNVGEAIQQFVLDDLSVASSSSGNSKTNTEKSKTVKKNTHAFSSSPLHSLGEEEDSISHTTFEDCRSNLSDDDGKKQQQDGNYHHGYHTYSENGDFFSVLEEYPACSKTKTYSSSSSPKPATPPPPPTPLPQEEESAGWEFLNPFCTYDHDYYSRYKIGSAENSINSTEVREKEGIPELESIPEDDDGDDVIHNLSKVEKSPTKKSVVFEVESSLQTEESGPPSLNTALSMPGNRDVRKVAFEIEEHFAAASRSSGDMITVLKGCEEEESFIGGKLTVLDLLFAWESKLFKEVKNVEKLRITYDKKFRKLNQLSPTGGKEEKEVEDRKMESTKSPMHDLLIRIEISIRSINLISQEIHKMVVKELQDHLVELFQGFKKMWSCLLECHQKQLLATTETKIFNVTWKMATDAKATAKLEQEFLNWSFCFSEWIKTQRNYIESIHGWVVFLLNDKEPGKIADAAAFLLNGAPSIFVLCRDWLKLMNGVSEDDVIKSMHASAGTMHDLLEMQNPEKYPHRRRMRGRSMMIRRIWKGDRVRGRMSLPAYNSNLKRRQGEEEYSKGLEMNEAKEKHCRIAMRLDEEASRTLRTCLVPVLHALGCFMKDTLTSYEELAHSSKWLGKTF